MVSFKIRAAVGGGIGGCVVSLFFVVMTHWLYLNAVMPNSAPFSAGFSASMRALGAYSSWLILVIFGGILGVGVGIMWVQQSDGSGESGRFEMSEIQ